MILPVPGETALLLDLDGTLLDIAPTPDAVRVAPGLADALLQLRDALGGAMAVVTGRPIAQVDALLPGIPTAVAGEHGGAIRHAPAEAVVRADLPDLPTGWINEAAAAVALCPGAMLEQKRRGFVLHFRAAPQHGPALRLAADRIIAPLADRFQVLPALMAWEIRPRGADKGTAVHALAAHAPFLGRKPIFIGDDVTDEDGMVVARSLGGAGLQVDEWFGSAGAVRTWIAASAASVAAEGRWAALPLLV